MAASSGGGASSAAPRAPAPREPGVLRILQASDLQLQDIDRAFRTRPAVSRLWDRHVGDTKTCRERTLRLVEELAAAHRADFVMLTGDVVDGLGKCGVGEFEDDIAALAASLARAGLPWAYLPGSRELEAGRTTRAELLEVLRRLPGCAIPADATGFDYALRLPVRGRAEVVDLLAFDAPRQPFALSRRAVENARATAERERVAATGSGCDDDEAAAPPLTAPPVARLAFVHRPIEAYDDAAHLVGRQGGSDASPPGRHGGGRGGGASSRPQGIPDGGLVKATAGADDRSFRVDAVFCGYHHTSDCMRVLRRDGSRPMLLGYGRVGSFFPPSEREGDQPLPFLRGARLIEVRILERKAPPAHGSSSSSLPGSGDEADQPAPPPSSPAVLRTWVAHEASGEKTIDLVEMDLGSVEPRSPRVVHAPS